MIFGETTAQRMSREERQRAQYPELGQADLPTVFAVDNLRRSEGRPPTSFGKDVESTYARIRPADNENPGGSLLNRVISPEPPPPTGYDFPDPQALGEGQGFAGARPSTFQRIGQALAAPGQFLTDLLIPKQVQDAVPSQPEIERKYNSLMESDQPVAFGMTPRLLQSAVDLGTSFGSAVSTPGSQAAVSAVLGNGAEAARSATERLYGLTEPAQELTRGDRMLNTLKRTIGVGVPEDDIATPIMRERARVRQIAESQAARIGAIADDVERAFPVDKAGRIADLPGSPTIQDVAARLPQYEQYLDDAQRAALERLRAEVEPFGQAIREQGVDIASRADVQPGGFYLPRGNAAVEGLDEPVKVYAGRGMAGGKKGFERGATFDSMSEGIDAGYEYAKFRDALQGYAKSAADRAVDSWAVNQFKASGVGETPKEAVLRMQPELASAKAALDRELQRLRGLVTGLNERTQTTIERFISDPSFDSIDDLRAALPETVRRGANAGEDIRAVRTALAEVKQAINDIRPDWNRAMERARMPRDRGGIGFSGLQGTSFPDEVANVANKYLNAEKPPTGKGAQVVSATNALNGLLRGLRASADVSFMAIQGLLGAARHPKEYGKALSVAFKALGDDRAAGAFITQFDDAARAAGRPDSAAWNAVGNRFGGSDTEFAIGKGIAKIGPAIANAPIIKQSNRAFGVFGDVLRLASNDALYAARQNAGKAVGDQEMADIAKFSNLMTGWSQSRFLGDTGQLVQFAPRFFQSQLDLVGNALTNRGIVGQESRRSLATLAGIGTALTVAANEARGHETDFNPESPNFMRIRDVGGTDVSLFGPWDSFMRAVVNGVHGDLTYLARSKASPVVALAWDLFSGKSFTGEDTRTPEYLMRQLLPFGLSDIGTERNSPVSTALGLAGVKATPLSPSDNVKAGKFNDLPPKEQFRAIKPEAWQRVQQSAPENLKNALKDYDSLYDWYEAAHGVYEERALKQGKTRAEAQRIADALTRAHPAYQMYLVQRKLLTNQWVIRHPDVARELDDDMADLPPSERSFKPTKAQRAVIGTAP